MRAFLPPISRRVRCANSFARPRNVQAIPKLKALRINLFYVLGFMILNTSTASALPSCSLSDWLVALNAKSNAYIASIGFPQESFETRQFRVEMERHPRARLLEHISRAELEENKVPLMDFISARRHLLNLSQNNWSEEAQRFGQHPQFTKQAANMSLFLAQTDCVKHAAFDLNTPQTLTGVSKFVMQFKTIFSAPPPIIVKSKQDHPATFDPDNFDDFKSTRYLEKKPRRFNPKLPRAIAVVAGLFTFVMAIAVLIWLRPKLKRGHANDTIDWTECGFPIYAFDGASPQLIRCIKISKTKAELHWTAPIKEGATLLLNFGIQPIDGSTPEPTEHKARVRKTDTTHICVSFRPALNSTQLHTLLGSFYEETNQMLQNIHAIKHVPDSTDTTSSAQSDSSTTPHDHLETFSHFMHQTFGATSKMIQDFIRANKSQEQATEVEPMIELGNTTVDGVTIRNKFHAQEKLSSSAEHIKIENKDSQTKNGAPKDAI